MRLLKHALMLKCSCDELVVADAPVPEQPVSAIAQLSYTCSNCGTKYFIHVQESKGRNDNENEKVN